RILEFRSLLNKLPEGGARLLDKDSAREAEQSAQIGLFGEEPLKVKGTPSPRLTLPISKITRPHVISDLPALNDFVAKLNSASIISVDTETTGIDPNSAKLIGISISIKEGEGYYIPLQHQTSNAQLLISEVIQAITPSLTNPKIKKIGHNIGYDYTMLKRHGLTISPISFDTMIAEFITDPSSRNLGLKNLAFIRLGLEMTEIKELIGTGKKQITFDQVPLEPAAAYAVADCDVTLRLYPILKKEMDEKQGTKLFEEIELPLITVLAGMEMNGVAVDTEYLGEMSKQLDKQIASLEKKIYKVVGYEFNINSTQQLAKALFEDLKLEPPESSRKTAAGKYSTAADVLEEMR
ncbi:MAG: DNA polymerase, partial [Chloroflexota bacterium]